MLNCPPVANIVDLIYPVGSYFITESADLNTVAKVQAHFGGTWVQVTERFLYASTSAGGTGGSNDAKLVSHTHTFIGNTMTGKYGTQKGPSNRTPYGFLYRSPDQSLNDVYASGVFSKDNNSGDRGTFGSGNVGAIYVGITFSGTPSGTNSTEGQSATNANMPAYRTVYMFRRTA